MVVRLQGRTLLPLGQDNRRVKHLVELGQVEDPTQIRQALVPQTASICGIRQISLSQLEVRIGDDPPITCGIVQRGIAVTPGPIDLAQGVRDPGQAVGITAIRPRVAEGPEHGGEGPGGVDGEEDIVQDDEELEHAGLAEGVGLVGATFVDAIDEDDGEGVETGDGDGNTHVEELGVEVAGDVEGLVPRRFREVRRRKDMRELVGREFQHGHGGKADAHGGRARGRGQVVVEHTGSQ